MAHTQPPRRIREPQLLRSVREAAQRAGSLEDALRAALQRICAATGWQAGRVEFAQEAGELASRIVWHVERPERLSTLRGLAERRRRARGAGLAGLAGKVLRDGAPQWRPNPEEGAAAVFAFPAVAHHDARRGGVLLPRQRAAGRRAALRHRQRLRRIGEGHRAQARGGDVAQGRARVPRPVRERGGGADGRRSAQRRHPRREPARGGPVRAAARADAGRQRARALVGRRRGAGGNRARAPLRVAPAPRRQRRGGAGGERQRRALPRRAGDAPLGARGDPAGAGARRTAGVGGALPGPLREQPAADVGRGRGHRRVPRRQRSGGPPLRVAAREVPRHALGRPAPRSRRRRGAAQRAPAVERHRTASGEAHDLELSVHEVVFEGRRALLVAATDITERKSAEEKLLHDALHDALTGLPNRSLFKDRLGEAMARLQGRQDYRFAVLFLDLDRFKIINDSLGHMRRRPLAGAGCAAARGCRLARRHRGAARRRRVRGAARGLRRPGRGDCARPSASRRRWRRRTTWKGPRCSRPRRSASRWAGPATPGRVEELLRDADTAMYRAKGVGRATHAVFDHLDARARDGARCTSRPTCAAPSSGASCVCATSRSCRCAAARSPGVEALVRWEHPSAG